MHFNYDGLLFEGLLLDFCCRMCSFHKLEHHLEKICIQAVSPMAAGNKDGLHLAQTVKRVQNCTFSFSTQSVDVNIECESYK